jgi:hypothetical protein
MIAIITPSMDSTTVSHRSSVRVTSSSGTMPSGSRRLSGLVTLSANGASRDEQNKIEEEPADEEQANRNPGKDERTARAMFQRLGNRICVDRRRNVFYSGGGRHMVFNRAVGRCLGPWGAGG